MDDLRGGLVAADFGDDLPFLPQRFFTVFDVPSADVRGAHAHRVCEQLLVCVQGAVRAVVDDGAQIQEFVLDRPEIALHTSAMIWGTQYRYTSDAVLLCSRPTPTTPPTTSATTTSFSSSLGASRPRPRNASAGAGVAESERVQQLMPGTEDVRHEHRPSHRNDFDLPGLRLLSIYQRPGAGTSRKDRRI